MITAVDRTTALAAPAEMVWSHATSPAGINAELAPWLRMTVPRGWAGGSLADLRTPVELGRSWILLFKVLPIDCARLTLAEVGPGMRFVERSRLVFARVWGHEREVRPAATGCELVDRVSLEPAVVLQWLRLSGLVRSTVARLFAHRHRRLAARFGRA